MTIMKQTSRQMAYDRDMHGIVRLIDIFDKQSHKNIVKYLGKRCIKEINQNSSPDLERPKSSVIKYLLSEDGHMLGQMLEDNMLDDKNNPEMSTKLYKDVEVSKPMSDFMYVFEDRIEEESSSRLNSHRALGDQSEISSEQ